MDATSLPPACGEVTEIPGIPSIGCVAVLEYQMGSLAGFSCCVVASREEVYLLGPDLSVRDGSLTSVQLWRPHMEAKVARLNSLVAFFLSPTAHETPNISSKQKNCAEADEVCAIVAWEDDGGRRQQHLTALFFPLLQALSTSQNAPVRSIETQFLHERNQQRVLRLFYHPSFVTGSCKGKHVVLCSGYDETVRKDACLTLSEEHQRHILTPGDPRGDVSGMFSFVLCNAVIEKNTYRWDVIWTAKAPAWVAPWIEQPLSDGVVCALAVQQEESSVVAAVGTTNGHLHILHSDCSHVSYRFGGPISDLAFVNTQCNKGEERHRIGVVTELVHRQEAKTSLNLNNTPEAVVEDDAPTCLVILDSLGRVIVLRDFTGGTESVQVVPDIQHFITLAEHRAPCSSSSSAIEGPASARSVTVGLKRFSDISSLRHVFNRRRPKEAQSDVQNTTADPTSIQQIGTMRQSENENGMFAGHILSRGLFSLTSLLGPRGYAELVVSTMGRSLVSIPFDKNEGAFSIAGFIEAPEAMLFVGFVDFLNTGVAELLMAGKRHVLVARRSRHQQKTKAALLLQLLERQKMHKFASGDTLLGSDEFIS
ncbi:hypothetical protein TraAM80_00932 [Trypanosoma rangeli]|uniref:Uncharacterized protein n=1 Tax=Trypanosoma rangeli TaxID=5698 RepID=A0A3R7KX70_TRYRA|nr:uncharacterized protein TraAM80_00932 [Trypanosoma rangeli]RNF11486.1 hypothetical protein TraAM80_00932 [Trypanosoma rangeli]|eukprot:RNF11486.1 hypothetical protein TraAM80_00932 [Trypanosoma rangeli]